MYGMIKWQGPFCIGDWLRDLHVGNGARPPEKLGAYVISLSQWTDSPASACRPLYVGGQTSKKTSKNSSLRIRLGPFFSEAFGFFPEDEHGKSMRSMHSGGQSTFKWCREQHKSLLDLWLAWCIAECHRCVEVALYNHLKPSGTLLNKVQPSACKDHSPPMT